MPMKEQVTDTSKVLQGMTEEIRLLRGTVNQQYAEIIKLNRNINALNLEIRKKDTELINLRERLAKYENLDKNSNNSSTPPSKERINDEVSEEQEASVSQVVRSREDKRGMMGISCLALPYLTR